MATDNKTTHCSVLKEYPRAVVHLRHQVKEKRFSLVLGAGVGTDFHIPRWETLVEKIASSPEIKGKALLKGDVKIKALRVIEWVNFMVFRAPGALT